MRLFFAALFLCVSFSAKSQNAAPYYGPDSNSIVSNAELFKFIEQNIGYPEEALIDLTYGTVLVRLVITKNGEISNICVISNNHPALQYEAERVIRNAKKWHAGLVDGLPADYDIEVPVEFILPLDLDGYWSPKVSIDDMPPLPSKEYMEEKFGYPNYKFDE